MEIRITRGKESRKGGVMSGKNTKLTLEVDVALSEEDKALVEKYHDPSVSYYGNIRTYYDGIDEAYKQVKVDRNVSDFSKFRLVAHVDDGHSYLGNMQKFEKAVVAALAWALNHLEALDEWEGERTVTFEEE